MTYEEQRQRQKARAQQQKADLERQQKERQAQEERERQERERAHSTMREHVKRGQAKMLEQGLDFWISDVADPATRRELRALLIETRRAFLS